jgi:hypothetical protein
LDPLFASIIKILYPPSRLATLPSFLGIISTYCEKPVILFALGAKLILALAQYTNFYHAKTVHVYNYVKCMQD